jgi:hypothetical protein
MNYIRSIVTWIDSLESGGHFQKWVSILVNVLGILALISAIVWGIAICVGSIAASNFLGIGGRTLVVIGSILSLCIHVVVGVVLIMLFRNRSKKIGTLGDETHFALLPITVILIRLFGELGFILCVATGIQALLASIFGSGIPDLIEIILSDLMMPRNVSFIFGVISLVGSVFAGAVVLIIHYFIAELINLFVDMATNLRKIQTTLSAEENTSDAEQITGGK